jgi:CheY-like chemotaxis protein
MNGFDCLIDIRNFCQFSNIDIIVYSTTYVKREVKQLRKDGANQFMQKPNSFEELINLLSKSLEQVDKSVEQKSTKRSFMEFI